jgi:tetratricopeptide (TPR) repeat protein
MKIIKTFILLFLILNFKPAFSQFSPQELYAKGLKYYYDGNFQEAVNYFDKYIDVINNDVNGYKYRGLSYMSLKNYPRALEDFTDILSRNITNGDAYINRGYTYFLQGNLTSAKQDFSSAIQYSPNNIDGYVGRSRVFIAMGNLDNALTDMNSASGVEPENPRVYINKAWVNSLADDTAKFFYNVNKALYYDSNIVFTSLERDMIFLRVEIFKGALEIADAKVRQFPDSYLANFTRGFLYYVINRYSDSSRDLNKSVQLRKDKDPGFINTVNILLRSIDRNS